MNENPDHEKWLEQHDEMLADHDREISEIRALQARTDKRLDRAIRFAVADARRQRRVNAEQRQTNAGYQASIERLNNALAAFLERGGNGKH